MPGNITLPAASFAVLTTGLSDARGAADSVLREAGVTAGRVLAAELAGDDGPAALSSHRFWDAMSRAVRDAGLGSVGVESASEAWIILVGADLAEPEPHAFTVGVLEGLLTTAAGEPVGILASPVDDLCRFVAASPRLLRGIERRLGNGATLDDALRSDAEPG